MKTRSKARNYLSLFAAAGVVVFHVSGIADAAADHFWNIGGTGGGGIWGTGPGDRNWNTSVGGILPNQSWPDAGDHVANFNDGTGGTITIFGTVAAAGMVLDGAPYTLEAGTLVLARDGSGNAPFIDVRAGLLTIDAELAGTDGWIKNGAGNLVLSGFNTYSGTIEIAGGTLTLGASGALADTGTLVLGHGTTLALGSHTETIGSLLSNGGTISGTGTLTGSSYTLNNGTLVAVNLGAGNLATSGAVSITGTSGASTVEVTGGTLTLSGNNLADTALLALAPGSTLTMAGGDTVAALISSGIVTGPGTLRAAHYQLNDGSAVSGNLGNGTITTTGMTAISGSTGTGTLVISSGTLDFSGTSAAATVAVDAGATLLHGGTFSAVPEMFNSGTLVMAASGTASAYTSAGGTLTGPGTLTAATYALDANSVVDGNLGGGILTTNGAVTLTGRSSADFIHINSGTLFNSGILGNPDSRINIVSGATLGAGGTRNFGLLTTSGSGAGIWQGDLTNTTGVAPGGIGTVGALQITGNFTNTTGATLAFDVGATGHDLLRVAGLATLAGTLELNHFGAVEIPLNIPLQIIDAASYAGNFRTISENLTGDVLFNPASGEITRLSFSGPSSLLTGATPNQTAVFISLYDDVLDPGIANVTSLPGATPPFQFTGGIADARNPDLLAALGASITPDGLDRALLNRLSPEGYSGFTNYAMQATRSRQRAALAAPALATAAPTAAPQSAKDAKQGYATPPKTARAWEVFAAIDYFDGGTSASRNRTGHDLSGTGLLGGGRVSFGDRYRAAAYLSIDEGDIRGTLIDAGAEGWTIGLLGEMLLDHAGISRLLGGLAYSGFSFDGSRASASATAGGWTPGPAGFRDVDGSALDAFIGVDATLYQTGRFRVIPAIGVRYSRGSSDSFVERQGAGPGLPITLAVDRVKQESIIAELRLTAEADLTDRLTLRGGVGFHAGLKDDSPEISARFVTGSRPMTVQARGLSEDLLFINLGAAWRAGDSVSVGINYRTEIRSGAEALNQISLGTSFGF